MIQQDHTDIQRFIIQENKRIQIPNSSSSFEQASDIFCKSMVWESQVLEHVHTKLNNTAYN